MANNPKVLNNLTPFKPWQSWNPNGRPKKWIALCNAELKEKWYDPVTKKDIEINYMSLMNLNKEELYLLLEDRTKPMLIQILAKNILSKKWFDVIEKMLDRWIWKAVQSVENNWTIKHEFIKVKLPWSSEEENKWIEDNNDLYLWEWS